jgi:hypothetical protein
MQRRANGHARWSSRSREKHRRRFRARYRADNQTRVGEWPGGIAPPGSLRTGREGLPSSGPTGQWLVSGIRCLPLKCHELAGHAGSNVGAAGIYTYRIMWPEHRKHAHGDRARRVVALALRSHAAVRTPDLQNRHRFDQGRALTALGLVGVGRGISEHIGAVQPEIPMRRGRSARGRPRRRQRHPRWGPVRPLQRRLRERLRRRHTRSHGGRLQQAG